MKKILVLLLLLGLGVQSVWADQVSFSQVTKIIQIHNSSGISFEVYLKDEVNGRKKIRLDMKDQHRDVAKDMRELYVKSSQNQGYVYFIPQGYAQTREEKVQYLEVCEGKNCIGVYSR